MDADTAADQQPRIALLGISRHALERLAVEQRDGQIDAGLRRLRLADAQVGLVDLRETAVDDLLVQSLLLLEAKDL